MKWFLIMLGCAVGVFLVVWFFPHKSASTEVASTVKVEAPASPNASGITPEQLQMALEKNQKASDERFERLIGKLQPEATPPTANTFAKLPKEPAGYEYIVLNGQPVLRQIAKADAMKPPVADGYVPREETTPASPKPAPQATVERIVYVNREVPTTVAVDYTPPVNYYDGTWVKLYSPDKTTWSWRKKNELEHPVHCTEERCGTPVATPVAEACGCEEQTTVCSDSSTNQLFNNWFSGNTLQLGFVAAPYRERPRMAYPERRQPPRMTCPPPRRPPPPRCAPPRPQPRPRPCPPRRHYF